MVAVNHTMKAEEHQSSVVESNAEVVHKSPGSEELNNEVQDGERQLTSEDERLDTGAMESQRKVKIFLSTTSNEVVKAALKSVDSTCSSDNDQMEAELKAVKRDNESLLARLFEFERERVELSEERDSLKEQVQSKSKRVVDLEAKVGALLRERERSKEGKSVTHNSVDTQSRLTAAETQCRRLKEDRETLTTQNRILRNQVDAYITSLKKSDDANKALQKELDDLKAEVAKFEVVETELDVAKRDSNMKSAALRALSGQIADREIENSSLSRSADCMDRVHRELRREVVDLQSRLASVGMEVLSLRDLNARLDTKNLATLEKENAELKSALQESREIVGRRERELEALEGSHRSVQSLLCASKKMQATIAERMRELQGVEAKNLQLNALLAKFMKSEQELNILKGVHKSMLSVMDASRIRQARMIQAEKDMKTNIQTLEEELLGAQTALSEKEEEVKSLGASLEIANAEVEVLKGVSQVDKSLINASNNQKASLVTRARDLDTMLSDVKSQAVEDKEAVVAENARLRMELADTQRRGALSNIDLVALAVGGLVATLLFAFLIKM